jgi:RHH-type rel operon transcriptional repressor/antitoxin RelB
MTIPGLELVMASQVFSIRLDDETRARLEAAAAASERPVTQVAARAIKRWLDAQDELDRQIEAAEREADAGAFISAERMDAWMASWGTDAEGPPPEPDVLIERSEARGDD